MKVWDIMGGKGRLLRTLSNHQKTITSLIFDGEGTRILSAGLDHHIKVMLYFNIDININLNIPAK